MMGDFVWSLEIGMHLDAIPVLPEILPWNLSFIVNTTVNSPMLTFSAQMKAVNLA